MLSTVVLKGSSFCPDLAYPSPAQPLPMAPNCLWVKMEAINMFSMSSTARLCCHLHYYYLIMTQFLPLSFSLCLVFSSPLSLSLSVPHFPSLFLLSPFITFSFPLTQTTPSLFPSSPSLPPLLLSASLPRLSFWLRALLHANVYWSSFRISVRILLFIYFYCFRDGFFLYCPGSS